MFLQTDPRVSAARTAGADSVNVGKKSVIFVCSAYPSGGGELKLWCGMAGQLAKAVAQARHAALHGLPDAAVLPPRAHNLSKSDGDLRSTSHSDLGTSL